MNAKEILLWSVALPGFGQLLNGKYVKGLLFILLEFTINVQSDFNEIIYHSFNGEISKIIEHTEYQWIMFYPCLYFFAMWDAFKDTGGGKEPYSYLPFLLAAYFTTLGVIFAVKIKPFGISFGIMWFSMICAILGITSGIALKSFLLRKMNNEK